MTTADLTLITKIALGLAIAGFFVSFSSFTTSNINAAQTCEFTDYGKIVLGALAIMAGGLGELSAFRMARAHPQFADLGRGHRGWPLSRAGWRGRNRGAVLSAL